MKYSVNNREGSDRMGKKKNFKMREVVFSLYFNPSFKESYTRIYDVLLETHNRTYEAIYKDVKENYEKVREVYQKEANEVIRNNYNSEHDDGSEYSERVENYVVDRIEEQSLMHYQFELMSLSNLYQVFEQQLRKWLFVEMTHNHNEYINQIKFTLKHEEESYGKFYDKFRTLEDLLKEMNLTFSIKPAITTNPRWAVLFGDNDENGIEVPIVETEIWKTIHECNLLSNTFKHGSGPSATNLYEINPDYFEKVSDTKLMHLYRTTNMEEVLNIDKISFVKYVKAMKDFWEKLKEHQRGSVMLKIDMSSEQEVQSKEPTPAK